MSVGPVVSGSMLAAISLGNFFVLLHWAKATASMFTAYLIRTGSAYIVWFNGVLGAILIFSSILFNNPRTHPFARKQVAIFNIGVIVVFAVSVFSHGLKSANDTAILHNITDKVNENTESRIVATGINAGLSLGFFAIFERFGSDPLTGLAILFMINRFFAFFFWCFVPTVLCLVPLFYSFIDLQSATINVEKLLEAKTRRRLLQV